MSKTDDEILLEEILEIFRDNFTNGSAISKLTTSSMDHLKNKYEKFGVFMKEYAKYFDFDTKKALYKTKPEEIQIKETISTPSQEIPTKIITNQKIVVDSNSEVPLLEQFLNQFNSEDWVLKSCVFNNIIDKSQRAQILKPYKTMKSFLKNTNYFEVEETNNAIRLKKDEKIMKPEKKFTVEENPKIETKIDLKETKGSLKQNGTIDKTYKEKEIRNIPILKINESEVLELLKILPQKYFEFFHDQEIKNLVDIEMDLNRFPKAHFSDKRNLRISEDLVTMKEIEYVTQNLNILPNNRSGIERFLHRISVIKSIEDDIIGVTLRVGKPIVGLANIISDILDEKKSILFLGPPGNYRMKIKIQRDWKDQCH
jgi:hypothetical protein